MSQAAHLRVSLRPTSKSTSRATSKSTLTSMRSALIKPSAQRACPRSAGTGSRKPSSSLVSGSLKVSRCSVASAARTRPAGDAVRPCPTPGAGHPQGKHPDPATCITITSQFSRPLPGPPWSGENGVGLARVHAVSSLMRSARGFSLAWSRRVRDRGLLPRARDADSFVYP